MTPLLSVLAGFFCGLLSGLGIGGGSLLLIWMTAVVSLSHEAAKAINLLYFLPTAAVSLLLHAKHKLVKWRVVLPAAAAGCAFGALTAFLTASVDHTLLQKLFGLFLLAVGVKELFTRAK